MMWMVVQRQSAPDAPYWPGRRFLASMDALAWPLGAAWALVHVAGRAGLLLPVAAVGLIWLTLSRLGRAVWRNHRYRFTTVWVARVLVVLWVVALASKLLGGH